MCHVPRTLAFVDIHVDNKLLVARIMISYFKMRVDNIVGKGETTDYQHFPLFVPCFRKHLFLQALVEVQV